MHTATDLSDKGLFTIDQTVEMTGYSHTTVSSYSRKLNVEQIKGSRYFSKKDIQKMNSMYMKKDRSSVGWVGYKYKYLKAIENTGKKVVVDKKTGGKSYVWKWQCVCGKVFEAPWSDIKRKMQSCGCKNLEAKRKVGKKAVKNIIKKYKKTNIVKITSVMSGKFLQKNNSTGVNGVGKRYVDGKLFYYARIGFMKKSISLGYFTTLEKAKKARKLAETKYYEPLINEYKTVKEIKKAIKDEVEKNSQ